MPVLSAYSKQRGNVAAYTKAAYFQKGTTTEILARFSSVAGEAGSPDNRLQKNMAPTVWMNWIPNSSS